MTPADAATEAIEEALTGLVPAYWAAPGDLARVALGALVGSEAVRNSLVVALWNDAVAAGLVLAALTPEEAP